jgi:hypothetical protein
MNKVLILAAVAALGVAGAGCASSGQDAAPAMAKAKSPYSMKGDQVEGCECSSVCPCVFANDATFADCRGIMAYHIQEGRYGTTDLGGINFALVLLKSGRNVPKTMGTWEGVIIVGANASPEQKNGIVDVLSSNWGKAFAKVDVRSEPIDFRKQGENFEVHVGKTAVLKTTPLKGHDGKAPVIEHAAFSLIPVLHCATTTENTYDDGKGLKWDFKERNSFYGSFDYRGE